MISPRNYVAARQHSRRSDSPSSSPSTSSPPARKKNDRQSRRSPSASDRSEIDSTSDTATMAAGSRRRESSDRSRLSPAPAPKTMAANLTRPTSSSSPVQIPVKSKSRDSARPPKHHKHPVDRGFQPNPVRRPRDVHSPDAIPPSVAALLAVTSIPIPKASRHWRQSHGASEKRMTVESIIESSHGPDKELSLRLAKSPLELLLTAPDELDIDEISVSDSNLGSALSTRTISLDSVPSLDDSFTADTASSVGTPQSPPNRRKAQPTPRSPEPLSSPPGEEYLHPLSARPQPVVPVEEIDFRVFESRAERAEPASEARLQSRPLRSAFKSNLTASLRAIRQAARTFSTLNFTSIPPEDFLTRSILTIDPQVPYTDERRPPPLEEEPTAALRRYLNPTTSTRIDQTRSSLSAAAPVLAQPVLRSFTASIQMQTYRVQRSRSAPPASTRLPSPPAVPGPPGARDGHPLEYPAPGPRQREMRENSDFIRIAVMEMAMRKRGKLDDQRPGRARWALPPRKVSSKPYEVRQDGVPARWVPVSI